jgi:hypothetical protein
MPSLVSRCHRRFGVPSIIITEVGGWVGVRYPNSKPEKNYSALRNRLLSTPLPTLPFGIVYQFHLAYCTRAGAPLLQSGSKQNLKELRPERQGKTNG